MIIFENTCLKSQIYDKLVTMLLILPYIYIYIYIYIYVYIYICLKLLLIIRGLFRLKSGIFQISTPETPSNLVFRVFLLFDIKVKKIRSPGNEVT